MKWILQEPDRIDDDVKIETHEDFSLYSIAEGGVTGFGVFKNGEYWAIWEEVIGFSLEKTREINEALYQEALRFGKAEIPGQLSLFED